VGWALKRTFGILHLGDQADFGEVRYIPVNAAAAAQTGYLLNERRGNKFMVLATLFNLRRTVSGGQRMHAGYSISEVDLRPGGLANRPR
jgi:hypothetical protein